MGAARTELAYSGMLVKELAALSGVNKYSIDNYLNARGQVPSVEAAVKIARALGVTVEYLVNGGEDNHEGLDTRLSGEALAAARLIERLNRQNRKFVFEFIGWIKFREDREEKKADNS
jgi:transcriptional regulator with XRE-family HTH domain